MGAMDAAEREDRKVRILQSAQAGGAREYNPVSVTRSDLRVPPGGHDRVRREPHPTGAPLRGGPGHEMSRTTPAMSPDDEAHTAVDPVAPACPSSGLDNTILCLDGSRCSVDGVDMHTVAWIDCCGGLRFRRACPANYPHMCVPNSNATDVSFSCMAQVVLCTRWGVLLDTCFPPFPPSLPPSPPSLPSPPSPPPHLPIIACPHSGELDVLVCYNGTRCVDTQLHAHEDWMLVAESFKGVGRAKTCCGDFPAMCPSNYPNKCAGFPDWTRDNQAHVGQFCFATATACDKHGGLLQECPRLPPTPPALPAPPTQQSLGSHSHVLSAPLPLWVMALFAAIAMLAAALVAVRARSRCRRRRCTGTGTGREAAWAELTFSSRRSLSCGLRPAPEEEAETETETGGACAPPFAVASPAVARPTTRVEAVSTGSARYARAEDDAGDFGSLEVHEMLGRGGYAKVYRAHFRGANVAVKVFRNADSIGLDAVAKEASVLRRVRHPLVCLYFGVATVHGQPAIVLEYMAGGTLHCLLKLGSHRTPQASSQAAQAASSSSAIDTHGLPPEARPAFERPEAHTLQLLRLGAQVATGIRFLHAHVIFHRDLKCLNVLLDEAQTVAKVSDFGLAHVLSGSSVGGGGVDVREATPTPSALGGGAQYGTLRYLAPECAPRHPPATAPSVPYQHVSAHAAAAGVARGGTSAYSGGSHHHDDGDDDKNNGNWHPKAEDALTARDMYAWGCLLYELTHELTAFGGMESLEAFLAASSDHRPPIDLPSELDDVAELIHMCWHPEPAQRGAMTRSCAVLESVLARYGSCAQLASHSSSLSSSLGRAGGEVGDPRELDHGLRVSCQRSRGRAMDGSSQSSSMRSSTDGLGDGPSKTDPHHGSGHFTAKLPNMTCWAPVAEPGE